MNDRHTPNEAQEVTCVEQCRTAIEALARAQQSPPLLVLREADLALRATVRLRDALIERLRRDDASPHWRVALDHVNVALSLIVALEYPTGGIQREAARQARDVLKRVLDQGLLDTTLRPAAR